jgi:chemotaxis protein MotB
VPINTARFPSNWELSTTRSTNVIKFFINEAKIEPNRLSASGYGEYYPIADNDTPEGRAKNRRVDIVILSRFFETGIPEVEENEEESTQ